MIDRQLYVPRVVRAHLTANRNGLLLTVRPFGRTHGAFAALGVRTPKIGATIGRSGWAGFNREDGGFVKRTKLVTLKPNEALFRRVKGGSVFEPPRYARRESHFPN